MISPSARRKIIYRRNRFRIQTAPYLNLLYPYCFSFPNPKILKGSVQYMLQESSWYMLYALDCINMSVTDIKELKQKLDMLYNSLVFDYVEDFSAYETDNYLF